jgi:sugar/nucleoside kinase (ribokinase family)
VTVQYVVAGNFCIDTVISPTGEQMDEQLGGTAVYGAVGAHVWSDSVGVCTVVGKDYASRVRAELGVHGIDVQGIKDGPQTHGLIWFTGYLSGDERVDDVQVFASSMTPTKSTRYVMGGSARHRRLWPIFSPSPSNMPDEYSAADRVHLAPMPLRRLAQNAAWYREHGAGVSIDWPFWRGTSHKSLSRSLLREVDSVLPSLTELQQFRSGAIEAAATEIAAAGPQTVIVKRGSAGVRVFDFHSLSVTDVPAYSTVVRDPTGAGDAFCGGYTVGLHETGDPVEAAICGVVSASFVIEDFGALHALRILRQEAEERRSQIRGSIVGRNIRETA